MSRVTRGKIDIREEVVELAPQMDGYGLARQVRSELNGHPIRLAALTGYGRAEDHKQVLAAGFDEHLVEPVRPEGLTRVLRKPR